MRGDGGEGGETTPCGQGESVAGLHERVARTVRGVVDACDREGVRALVVCTHAATMIALGRVLTGEMPEDVEVEDFRVFTCGLSVFRRRRRDGTTTTTSSTHEEEWKGGKGVAGGWDCEVNGDCSFLSEGEERGW